MAAVNVIWNAQTMLSRPDPNSSSGDADRGGDPGADSHPPHDHPEQGDHGEVHAR